MESSVKQGMSRIDRFKRDGSRWRYIYLLERELNRAHGLLWLARALAIFCVGQAVVIGFLLSQ